MFHSAYTLNADASNRNPAINRSAKLGQHAGGLICDAAPCIPPAIAGLTEVSGPATVLRHVLSELDSADHEYLGYHERFSYAADCSVLLFDTNRLSATTRDFYVSKAGKYLSALFTDVDTDYHLMVHLVHWPWKKGHGKKHLKAHQLTANFIEWCDYTLDVDSHIILGDFNLTSTGIVEYADLPESFEPLFDHEEKNNIVYDADRVQWNDREVNTDRDEHLFKHSPVYAELFAMEE